MGFTFLNNLKGNDLLSQVKVKLTKRHENGDLTQKTRSSE